ncbi:MAG: HlyD family secretion protein [Gammaproteobacteria bacterium]
MTEKETATNDETEVKTKAEAEVEVEASPSPDDPLRRWTLIVSAVIVGLLCWYLVADRLTPFSSQARVKAYIVPIAPQVSGRVVAVNVRNNQLVEEGDVLVAIDPSSYELNRRSAEAGLTAARQELGAATAAVESARAGVDAARANLLKAQQDADRLERIYQEDPGAVSERRVQAARATLEGAISKLAQAQANVEQALQQQGDLGDQNMRILSATAALDQAELDLERTRIRAPGRGLVTDLAVDRGNFAQPGQPLMTFIAIHDLWIQADFTENNLGNVKPGDRVALVLDVQPGQVFEGTVRSVGYGVATSNDALGTLPTIDNDPNWLRSAQRFPVIVDFDPGTLDVPLGVRVGSQATVIVYTGDRWLLNWIGSTYIRLNSILSYAY